MLKEHAITYRERITITDLDYMVKKANRLGKSGRDVIRVYQEEDDEGVHVYFEVNGMHRENGNNHE
jgi:hypothetical protein